MRSSKFIIYLIKNNFVINNRYQSTRSTSVRNVDYESALIRSKSKVKYFKKITIKIIIEKIVSMKIRKTFDAQRSTRTSLFTRD